MADIAWPPSLPQAPRLRDTREQLGRQVLRTEMDAGLAKLRRRQSAGVDRFPLGLILTTAQVATLRDFFRSTAAGGALAFEWQHPHTGNTIDLRFVTEPEIVGLAPRVAGQVRYHVAFDVETVPGTEILESEPPPDPPAERFLAPALDDSGADGDEPAEASDEISLPIPADVPAPPNLFAFAAVVGDVDDEPDDMEEDEGQVAGAHDTGRVAEVLGSGGSPPWSP